MKMNFFLLFALSKIVHTVGDCELERDGDGDREKKWEPKLLFIIPGRRRRRRRRRTYTILYYTNHFSLKANYKTTIKM